ncbi:hypothetical protein P691DRAFT_767144 [Macrolepiota fuliginosa MF-IS2]|uniref:Uncharacterized protein n=1 Tax=Macrolepiota fuliginosa MF-IS2 TaxID=1400762 RepID=A0A9P5WYJ8_9AGAR|nr:hypothetical protein P691DRAFT_767144 [Macrolepiota fuliginosa MF-IS2]
MEAQWMSEDEEVDKEESHGQQGKGKGKVASARGARKWAKSASHIQESKLESSRAAELQEACCTNELLQELIKMMAGIEATQQEQLQVARSTHHVMRGQTQLLTEVRQNLDAIWQQGQAGLEDLESTESGDKFKEGASGDSEDREEGEEEEAEEEVEVEKEKEKEKEKASGEGGEMEVD